MNGKVVYYTPKETKAAEAAVAEAWSKAYGSQKFDDGPLGVALTFTPEGVEVSVYRVDWDSKLRGDIDNYAKTVLDGLNKVAWGDDKQIVELRVEKR